jgi:hypothetical protein
VYIFIELISTFSCCPSCCQQCRSELVKLPMQDKDGHAVIVALELISKDDEVLLFFFLFVKSSRSSDQEKKL